MTLAPPRIHIALLSAEYPPQPGGVGDYTRQLALALIRCGLRVTVLTGPARGAAAPLGHQGEPAVERVIRGWGLGCWGDIIAALHRARPDLLHIQYQTGAYAMHPAINLLPWRLRWLPGRPAIAVTFHDLLEPYLFPKAGPLRRWITLRLARDADAALVTNEQDARQLAVTPPAHMISIGSNIPVAPPPGYNPQHWRAQLGVQPNHTLVAYFGLLSRSKGFDLLLEALYGPASRLPNPRLLLIGGQATSPADQVYATQIAAQIERLGAAGQIIQTGHVDQPAVSAHLLAADAVALPFRDGASFRRGSLLAALAHGCPLVTTTNPQQPPDSRLVDRQNTLLVPPDDAPALAAALDLLASDSALRALLSTGARTLASSFTWQQIALHHQQLYTTLLL